MLASAQSPNHTAARTTGIATSANRVRCARFERPRCAEGTLWRGGVLASVMMGDRRSGGDLSEAPLAALKLQDSGEQIAAREVGPHHGNDVQLRVRELPEHEVRDALLAGGANQQVRVGASVGVEMRAERVLIDV